MPTQTGIVTQSQQHKAKLILPKLDFKAIATVILLWKYVQVEMEATILQA